MIRRGSGYAAGKKPLLASMDRKVGLVLGSSDDFKPVSCWTVEEVRTVLREGSAESCNLVDVRQPGEYESGHLPGARLIPIAELGDRLGELDRSKPTITY